LSKLKEVPRQLALAGLAILVTWAAIALALYARRISPELPPLSLTDLMRLEVNPYVIGLVVEGIVVPLALVYLLSNARFFRRVVSGETIPHDRTRLFAGLVLIQLLTLCYYLGFFVLIGEPTPPPLLLVIAGGLLGGWQMGLGLGLVTMFFCGTQDFLFWEGLGRLLSVYQAAGLWGLIRAVPWDRVFLWNYVTNLWASVAVWAGIIAGLSGDLLGERRFRPEVALGLGLGIALISEYLMVIAGSAPGFVFLISDTLVSGVAVAAIALVVRNVQAEAARRRVEAAELSLARAELRALRAQINPHFLFNALNTIRYFVRTDPETARRLLLNLSQLFQRALQSGELVPLRDELSYIEAYLSLEKARLGERLHVEWDIRAQDCLDQPVPTLILQPIVENAVVHGIARQPEGGTVRIIIERKGDVLMLRVEDNGPGIPPARLTEILSTNGKPEMTNHKAIGLRNVDGRLRAMYGDEYRLVIESELGRGTCVQIRIPISATEGGKRT